MTDASQSWTPPMTDPQSVAQWEKLRGLSRPAKTGDDLSASPVPLRQPFNPAASRGEAESA